MLVECTEEENSSSKRYTDTTGICIVHCVHKSQMVRDWIKKSLKSKYKYTIQYIQHIHKPNLSHNLSDIMDGQRHRICVYRAIGFSTEL